MANHPATQLLPEDRHIRSDLILMLVTLAAFAALLTALKLYDTKAGIVQKVSEKYFERFIKI